MQLLWAAREGPWSNGPHSLHAHHTASSCCSSAWLWLASPTLQGFGESKAGLGMTQWNTRVPCRTFYREPDSTLPLNVSPALDTAVCIPMLSTETTHPWNISVKTEHWIMHEVAVPTSTFTLVNLSNQELALWRNSIEKHTVCFCAGHKTLWITKGRHQDKRLLLVKIRETESQVNISLHLQMIQQVLMLLHNFCFYLSLGLAVRPSPSQYYTSQYLRNRGFPSQPLQ